MTMPDGYRIPIPSSHRVMTPKEVHLPPLAILEPLSNFVLFLTRNDWEAFWQHPSDHISILSQFLSTKLAKACTYMLQVVTYCICISMFSSPSAILYVWNTCTGDHISLAHHAYCHRVWGISSSPCNSTYLPTAVRTFFNAPTKTKVQPKLNSGVNTSHCKPNHNPIYATTPSTGTWPRQRIAIPIPTCPPPSRNV